MSWHSREHQCGPELKNNRISIQVQSYVAAYSVVATFADHCRILVCVLFISIIYHASFGQPFSDIYSVYLLSNFDDISPNDTRVIDFVNHVDREESPFAVVVNGDFADDPNLTHIKTLADAISKKPYCRLLLTQGDRDWSDSGPDGWESIKKIEKLIDNLGYPNVLWINGKACPGPEIITLDNHVQLIGINTQWFNHPHARPEAESGGCKIAEEQEFYEEIEDLIDDHSDQNVLIVGHYPFRSNGPYGGRFPVKDWLLPMPIVSGFITSFKKNVGGSKEINNENFQPMAENMLDILLARNSVIYASGHEKHFEILKHGDGYLLNAGNFGKTNRVKDSRFTVYKNDKPGFTKLIYVPDGEVRSELYTYQSDKSFALVDNRILFQAPCENPILNVPVNDRFIPCAVELPVLDQMLFDIPDSLTVTPNEAYIAGKFSKFFLGEHYRSAWTSPLNVPLLNLDTVHGGLIPFAKGGGRQTKSLNFTSGDGREFVFRSVDKDPSNSLEYDLRNTVIDILLQDQTTTQHPFGALAVPQFLKPLGVLHAKPKLFLLPDDPKLGPWRREYGNMLGMLEERPTDKAEDVFGGSDDIKRTVKMIRQLYKDRDNKIATNEFLRARLVDIVLGDWGRHEDNWKWAGYKQKKGYWFRPIPRDRDHVFSKWDGFLPWLADREWAKPSGENFDDDIHDIRSLTWQNRHMDRFLLSEADWTSWKNGADDVAKVFSKKNIDQAFDAIPYQQGKSDRLEVKEKIESRSTKIHDFARRYYNLLAKEVDVVGSNKHEYFDVERLPDGSVDVSVFKLKDRQKTEKYYHRHFLPDETKEIRLFGLSGKDVFNIHGDSKNSILLCVIPGGQKDTITDVSTVACGKKATRLYIDEHESDYVQAGKEIKQIKHAPSNAYDYDRLSFRYNTYFPLLYLFYNSDRGLDFGSQVTFTNHRYGKQDFSSKHKIKARLSTNGNVALRYIPRWNDVVEKWDVVGKFEFQSNRNFNFFFGRGLLEQYDQSLLDNNYYTFKYSMVEASVGLSREFWKNAEVSALFTTYYNTEQQNENSIADDQPLIRGLDSRLNTQIELLADLDLRDRNDLPRFGYRFLLQTKIGTDIKSEAGSFLSGLAHLESFNTFHPFTLGLRVGGSINEGDVPYFLMQYLGRNTYLRGFRQNRFLGDAHLFANSEVRIQLVNTKNAFIPLQFGIKLFADVGRVLLTRNTEEESENFIGYGGGIYLVPYKEKLTLNLVAGFSKEENLLFQFTLGKPF